MQRVTDAYAYNAWGENQGQLRSSTDTNKPPNPLRFVGKSGYYSDDDLGLDLLEARYYDPLLGRFITQDPDGEGLNWYEYADNDPVNIIDPTGTSGILQWMWNLPSTIFHAIYHVKRSAGTPGLQDAGRGNAELLKSFPELKDYYGGVRQWGGAVCSTLDEVINQAGWTLGAEAAGPIVEEVGGSLSGVLNARVAAAVRRGLEAHENYYAWAASRGFAVRTAIKGTRLIPDAIDFSRGVIYELKPNNARAIEKGWSQLDRYIKAARKAWPNVDWKPVLHVY